MQLVGRESFTIQIDKRESLREMSVCVRAHLSVRIYMQPRVRICVCVRESVNACVRVRARVAYVVACVLASERASVVRACVHA